MQGQVLIFEGDPTFANELQGEFTSFGCSVRVVDDGPTGYQAALALRPHLILVSVELPRSNGFSICNKLKRDPGLKEIPLVIMSSDSTDLTFEEHKKLKTMRAQAYVHKPISFGDLLQVLRPFLPQAMLDARASLHPPDPDDDDILVASSVSEESATTGRVERPVPADEPVHKQRISLPDSLPDLATQVSAIPQPIPWRPVMPAASPLRSSVPMPEARATRASLAPTVVTIPQPRSSSSMVAAPSVEPLARAGAGSAVFEEEIRLLRDLVARKERESHALRDKLVEANATIETLRQQAGPNGAKATPPLASLERAKNALTIATTALEELAAALTKNAE